MGQLLLLGDKQGWAVSYQGWRETASLSSFIPRVLCQLPSAAQTLAKSLEKAEMEPVLISVGITEVSWQWERLALLSAPTGLKLLVLDMCIYVTVAELTVLGSMGAL